MTWYLLHQLLLLLLARNGGKQKSGWACTVLMGMHTLHISNIIFLLSKSNTKDTLGIQENVTKPLRLEVTKSHSLGSDICTLDLLFSNRAQGHSDHGECPTAAGTSAHDALVTGHPTSERSNLLFPSNSAAWKDCQLHSFGLHTHQQA